MNFSFSIKVREYVFFVLKNILIYQLCHVTAQRAHPIETNTHIESIVIDRFFLVVVVVAIEVKRRPADIQPSILVCAFNHIHFHLYIYENH